VFQYGAVAGGQARSGPVGDAMFIGSPLGRALAGATVVTLASLLPAGVAQASSKGSGSDTCAPLVDFQRHDFTHSTTIDNKYLPMVPGTRLTYEGQVASGGGQLAHRVIFTVTDLVKEVDGVDTRVVYDVDESEGVVQEAELAFFAQDDAGNVWNLGEYPEEYEEGKFVGAPSVWLSGIDDATGGIHMPADAEALVDGPEYLQGDAPKIDFLDCARVASKNSQVSVPAGDFSGVLTTHERSPLDPGNAIQVKDHAPGVGIVRIGAINDPEAETLELVSIDQLSASELRKVDRAAFALDEHGRKVSDVYSGSAELRVEGGGHGRNGHGHDD
jgi:hypothetical protein